MSEFGGFDMDFHPFCEKCQRYYNGSSPHLCHPEDLIVDSERAKLKKWLGRGTKVLTKEG